MDFFQMLLTGVTTMALTALRTVLIQRLPYVPVQYESGAPPLDTYDFIVVGSGCGGSVVAARLAEAGALVLLLEAGKSATPESSVPSLTFLTLSNEDNFHYRPVSQKNGMWGYLNNSAKLTFGRNMGGTSTINGNIYFRGNRRDYDNWAKMGNPGWDYESVLPYFIKSENLTDGDVLHSDKYHGRNGPLNVIRKLPVSKFATSFLNAASELGQEIVDSNGPEQIGFTPAYEAIRDGVRATASESFLRPLQHLRNLHIRTNTEVYKILFTRHKRAVGVQYNADGKRRVVRVRKEVILSAGALNTPKVLILSGVGPEQHLKELGIPVVASVEGVGRNLQDHPNVFVNFIVTNDPAYSSLLNLLNVKELNRYLRNQTGYFAGDYSGGVYSWQNLGIKDDPAWTDTIIASSSALTIATVGIDGAESLLGMKREAFEDTYGPIGSQPTLLFIAMIASPKSKGTITLQSRNPADSPVIDLNLFDHPDDLTLIVRAIRAVFKIANTKAVRDDLGARYVSKPLRSCSPYPPDSDSYWACYAQHFTQAGFHVAGTAKMAPPSDPLGVVSNTLSVRGVRGLRVVDASIMPQIVSANTMAATYMIGEKGADMILETWGYPTDPLHFHYNWNV